jgi:hypothetical protein
LTFGFGKEDDIEELKIKETLSPDGARFLRGSPGPKFVHVATLRKLGPGLNPGKVSYHQSPSVSVEFDQVNSSASAQFEAKTPQNTRQY